MQCRDVELIEEETKQGFRAIQSSVKDLDEWLIPMTWIMITWNRSEGLLEIQNT